MYPPEPRIGYGVFVTETARPVEPGYSGPTKIGFGILNQPKDFYGIIKSFMDDQDLKDYLGYALEQHETEKARIDFDNIENKWEALIGLDLRGVLIRSDQVSFEFKAPGHGWRSMHATYSRTGLAPAIMSASEIQHQINYDDAMITGVEPDGVVVLSNGNRFAIMKRYLHVDEDPTWATSNAAIPILLRNLDTVRAARDSTVLEPA